MDKVQAPSQKPKQKRYDHESAECIGNFGYGNGRTGYDFCTVRCPAVEHCWRDTHSNAEGKADPSVSRQWRTYLQRFLDAGKTPRQAKLAATRRMLKVGRPDPALDVVMRNTADGVRDRYAGTSDSYRQIKGASWVYAGRVVGYFPLA